MEIKVGQKATIYCLSDKPEGTVTSVDENTVTIEIDKGILTVDKEDIIEENSKLQVLNYTKLDNKESKGDKTRRFIEDKFTHDMMNTIKNIDDIKNVYSMFMEYVRNSTEDDGSKMYPLPCVFDAIREGQSGFGLAGLTVPPAEIFYAIGAILHREKPKELIFGVPIDNMNDGGIDAKFKQVFCISRVKNGKWMHGALGFNNKEDLKSEPDWNNKFWTDKIKAHMGSAGIIPITDKIGTAYQNKIRITKWIESPFGYFYEGDIIVEKLDEKTQAFLKEKNLDPNNQQQVEKYFSDNNMKLDFMDTGDAIVNLMVSNTGLVFMDRKSRTRALLEAIEAIANK